MRNFVYDGVVGAVAMFAVSAGVHSQQIQPASIQAAMSKAQASGVVSIRALQATVDVATLPTQTLNYVD